DVVGRTIVRILRTEIEEFESEFFGSTLEFFHVVLELDSGCFLEVGKHKVDHPLALWDQLKVGLVPLCPFESRYGASECIGEKIVRVETTASGWIHLVLSSGRHFWVDEEEWGTAIRLEDEAYATTDGQTLMRDYWTD